MQGERSSLCRVLHHIKLIIFKIPLATSYKSNRRSLHQISAQNSFFWVLNSTKNLPNGKSDIKLGFIFG